MVLAIVASSALVMSPAAGADSVYRNRVFDVRVTMVTRKHIGPSRRLVLSRRGVAVVVVFLDRAITDELTSIWY
jgi:hypothetical protein